MRDVVIPDVAAGRDVARGAGVARESRRASSSARPKWRSRICSQEASKSYHDNPTALHLRAMNMLYEGLKEKGALMLVPSTAVESMGLGGMLGAAAAQQTKLSQGQGT